MRKQFDRNVRFFGVEGQKIISQLVVCIAGVGGLGSHIVQQLVHLGVTKFILIEPESLDETNLNRYVGAKGHFTCPCLSSPIHSSSSLGSKANAIALSK